MNEQSESSGWDTALVSTKSTPEPNEELCLFVLICQSFNPLGTPLLRVSDHSLFALCRIFSLSKAIVLSRRFQVFFLGLRKKKKNLKKFKKNYFIPVFLMIFMPRGLEQHMSYF